MAKRIDPTKNVLQLVAASIKRIDDLREADRKLSEAKNELMRISFEYEDKLRQKESDRLDANLEGLRNLIKSTQDTATLQLDRLTNRVSALELSQSQNAGRSGISTQLLIAIAIVVGGIIGGIVMAYFHTTNK